MLLGALAAGAAVITPSARAAQADSSTITSVDITRILPAGTFAGLAFRYIEGVMRGEVSAEEPIAGLRELAAGRTTVPYQVSFQIVAPEAASNVDAVVVEAPNRGRTIFPGAIGVPAPLTGPNADPVASAVGDAFLLSHRISFATIQWQTGFAAGVPQSAQGIGEVVVRDFGRWLGGAFRSGDSPLPIFRHRILAGVSQAAWFVNSLIAEGFNVDPETGRGVYQGGVHAERQWGRVGDQWVRGGTRAVSLRPGGSSAAHARLNSCPDPQVTLSWSRSSRLPTSTGCAPAYPRERPRLQGCIVTRRRPLMLPAATPFPRPSSER